MTTQSPAELDQQRFVWVFVGEERSPGAVFTDAAIAESWIAKWALTGILTKYPLDIGAYDWAVQRQLFRPKREEHTSGRFVGSFVGACMEHRHYENGRQLA